VRRNSAQYAGGMDAWNNRVHMILLMDRMTHSALPFCWDVRGQERRV
jgi:hypothetical protein